VDGSGNGSSRATLNANGHTMFEVNSNANMTMKDVKVTGATAATGSVLNVTNANATTTLNNVEIAGAGSAQINNAGKLNNITTINISLC